MRVLTREPDASHTLHPGETLAVPPNTPHFVEPSEEPGCQFMVVQGVGDYDYIPVDG